MTKFEFTDEQKERAKQTVARFLECITRNDWDGAYQLSQLSWKMARPHGRKILERMYVLTDFAGAKVTGARTKPNVFMIEVLIVNGDQKWIANVVPESAPMKINPTGVYGINPSSLRRR